MKDFFKYLLATIIGVTIMILVAFLFITIFMPKGDPTPSISSNAILKLTLNAPITETAAQPNPLQSLNFQQGIGLIDILESIKHAKDDDKIKGIYINMNSITAGFASLQEIRDALVSFKTSGKFVISYAESYSEAAYYLASVSDKIYLNPIGSVEFNGLRLDLMFYKGVFEKLGVKPNIFRVGQYKSAVEPYFLDKMSDSNRAQTTSFLNSLYDHYITNVSKSRKISEEKLHKMSDSLLVQSAEDALKYKLITDIAYEDQVLDELGKRIEKKKVKKILKAMVSIKKYAKIAKSNRKIVSGTKVAVLISEGTIIDGSISNTPSFGGAKTIASADFVEQIRKIRENDDIKAVVLRINSPGGSALASDVMWREIQLLKKEKTVIASMSDVAASGGYYMAMGCHKILAQPNTITGSIGIFGLFMEFEDFLKNKVGVTTDRVTTGKYSDIMSFTRHITEKEKAMIQGNVERGYEIFTSKAAKGRKMSIEALKKVASGRVWTGKQALENKLVDKLGGLDDAIALAAKTAGLGDDYMVKYYPKEMSFTEALLQNLNGQTMINTQLKTQLGDLYPYYDSFRKVQNMQGIQARLPFDVICR